MFRGKCRRNFNVKVSEPSTLDSHKLLSLKFGELVFCVQQIEQKGIQTRKYRNIVTCSR